MAFLKPVNSLKLKTVKGEIEIINTEYFILKEENGREPLIINKEGTQKIEDFFGVQTEIIGEGAILGSAYVKVRMTTLDGLKVERLGSANNKSLTNEIARAYAIEMAFKRACATAALEVLRKNYIGTEPLPLLYSSFDEFKTEDSLNQNMPVVEEEKLGTPIKKIDEIKETQVEKVDEVSAKTKDSDMVEADSSAVAENPFNEEIIDEKPIKTEEPLAEEKTDEKSVETEITGTTKPTKLTKLAEDDDRTISSTLGTFLIKSNKYRNGITLSDLAEKDINYLNWLVNGNNMKGRYKEYQENAQKFVKEANISLPA